MRAKGEHEKQKTEGVLPDLITSRGVLITFLICTHLTFNPRLQHKPKDIRYQQDVHGLSCFKLLPKNWLTMHIMYAKLEILLVSESIQKVKWLAIMTKIVLSQNPLCQRVSRGGATCMPLTAFESSNFIGYLKAFSTS